MDERRRFHRLGIALPLRMKLLGIPKYANLFKAQARNVSFEGLLIEVQVFLEDDSLFIQKGEDPIRLDPFLVLNEKLIELTLLVPPKSERVRATGKVVWYDVGSTGASYYFRMGISLEKMGVEDGKKWVNFIKTLGPIQD